MGTKSNPAKYDCYSNADPDEPMFVLLGRDRHAAVLTRIWALLRTLDDEDESIVAEALECAAKMDDWGDKLGKQVIWGGWPDGRAPTPETLKPSYKRVESLYFAATAGMHEHPEGFNDPCQCDLCLSYD